MDASVKLTVEEWNQVLDIMSDGSVRKAMPLINKIMEQCRQQMQQPQTMARDTTPPPIGEVRAEPTRPDGIDIGTTR